MKNLIAISGKIGSGKDTIFKVIQLLLTNKIRTARGATPLTWDVFTDSKNISVSNQRRWDESEFQNKKFADKLKQFASLMLGIPVTDLELEEVKNRVLGPEWNSWFFKHRCNGEEVRIPGGTNLEAHARRYAHIGGDEYYEKPLTVREFLQKLGTDAVRNNVHSNAWVNALFADYTPKYNHPPAHQDNLPIITTYPKWIITDCRFPNEAKAVEERGGLLIRVTRPDRRTSQEWQTIFPGTKILDPDGWDRKNYQFSWYEELITLDEYQKRRMISTCKGTLEMIAVPHPSETALDNHKFKYTINNSGTIEELIEQVRTILIKENIL